MNGAFHDVLDDADQINLAEKTTPEIRLPYLPVHHTTEVSRLSGRAVLLLVQLRIMQTFAISGRHAYEQNAGLCPYGARSDTCIFRKA